MSSYSSADDAYDSDEPPELELNLANLMDCASHVLGVKCTGAKKLTRGASHEIFTLQFQEDSKRPTHLRKRDSPALHGLPVVLATRLSL
jgi:hypothetical protein